MEYGTKQFSGNAGEHRNPDGRDCAGRHFQVGVIGRGMPACTNHVECLACHGHFEAYEHRLVSGMPITPIP